MIVAFVQFTYPPGLTREQILEDARTTVPQWRGNKELIRKHYIVGENGIGGAFYIWPSKEAAQRGHDAEWFANIKVRTGSVPTIRYFDLTMIVDNEAESVTEFSPAAAQAAEYAPMTLTPLRRNDEMPGSGHAARLAIRGGEHRGPTAGLAPGYVQGNLAILPKALAADFLHFCQLNPKPCPLIGMSAVGDPRVPELGDDLDIRTDLPRYRIWRNGELVSEPDHISDVWRDDLVSFVIGCSFSFEEALIADGIEMRHITRGCNVPMYRTSIETAAAGPFHGPMVVSMRPLTPHDAIRAVQITTRFPSVHGAPMHIGNPEMIGIKDIMKPDYGDALPVRDDELPVFWACGVTPQSVIATVKPKFCITHYPGSMLVTDRKNTEFATM